MLVTPPGGGLTETSHAAEPQHSVQPGFDATVERPLLRKELLH
tara:strand:+ start:1337 stop:1465 length:129 start_codon:yes stop_codon:yes gene_type:complete